VGVNRLANQRENILRVARRRLLTECPKDRKLQQSVRKEKQEIPEENQPQLSGPYHPLDGNVRPNGKLQKHDQ
jgi:hypothetical protein|tara:strand:+ start:545 stop:763 length:219 start_codon:yes stop_codon:yes gene_type:complete